MSSADRCLARARSRALRVCSRFDYAARGGRHWGLLMLSANVSRARAGATVPFGGRAAAAALALTALAWSGCSAREPGIMALDPGPSVIGDAGAPVDAAPFVPMCTAENKFCEPPPLVVGDGGVATACGSQAVTIEPVGVNVMLAVEGSFAMRNHWSVVQNGVKKMLESNSNLNYGAHLFWADVADFGMALETINICGRTENRVLDVAPNQLQETLNHLGPQPPGPGGRWFSLRPVIDPLRYYLEHKTALENPNTTNYLVFISNGNDNCFGPVFTSPEDKNLTYEKIGIELQKKNIRVLPIGFDGATEQRTLDGRLMTDFTALDVLAEHGGSGLKKALAADSPEQLEQAIGQVAQAVRSCRFKVPDALDPTKNLNPFTLTFLVNGQPVPRDRVHAQGWDFVQGNTSEVELFGDACVALKAGRPIEARQDCGLEQVCGTAATRITAKSRAIQFLMDRSATMGATCAGAGNDDPVGCLFGNYPTLWEAAGRSLAKAIVSTINDDAEFGLQYYPNPQSDCEVSPMPEVPPTQSSEISMLASLVANLPTGFTPLVRAFEQTAANPGRLGEPGVTGALIVLSDGGGGNTCEPETVTPEQIVTRLGQATARLRERGIKTYAIHFGPRLADFPQEDAQLRAIVSNGGTATGDPNDPNNVPYLEAPDESKLNEILKNVSEQLSSCDFVVETTNKDADKDRVNLYIDGEVIPFDASNAKQNGWGWLNPERTTITMYGESCTRFKNSRSTSIVVEFGCVPVVVVLN
jgi:hypothetical protein